MALNDVKEITIPEGSVKKIEDSNGNIIWGNASAFPYRRLEYIHLNGAESLWSQITTKSGYYRRLDFDLERNDVRQCAIAVFDGQSSSNKNRRFYLGDFNPSGGVRFAIGDSWSPNNATPLSDIPLNTKLRVDGRSYMSGSNNMLQYNLRKQNVDGTWTYIISTSTITGNSETLTSIQPYLGGCRTRTTSTSAVLENPIKGKIYYYEERSGTYQGTFTHQRYPAQRKSDGKCGLYDVTTNTFEVLNGTDIYQTAAGPTVDEYWDLTAPD